MKKVLLIGGSDSGAGAGIQADLKVVTAVGVYGTTVITTLTAQNTLGVQEICPVPPAFVAQQIDSIMQDIGTDALKTGMLLNKDIVKVVAAKIREYGIEKVVVDPIILSKGGYALLKEDAVEVLKSELLPISFLVMPNISEAERLTGVSIEKSSDKREAAERLHYLGARNVLIKGGHFRSAKEVEDLFYDGNQFTLLPATRIEGVNLHGSGCILASLVSAALAKGFESLAAIYFAREHLLKVMTNPLRIGNGYEVMNPSFLFKDSP